jgi:2-oxoglutarate ferredoxin oxidoreductase subunit gamma
MSRKGIVFSGSGGQGVITAAIIIAEAAVLYDGLNAVQTQSYGPEARGGATRADVIISEEPIYYPKVNHPQFLVCLTQEAYNKFKGIIRPGGLLLADSHHVNLKRKVDARQVSLDMYRHAVDDIGNPIVFNITVLGALVELSSLVKPDSIMKVLESKISGELLQINRKAFDIGVRLAKNCQ